MSFVFSWNSPLSLGSESYDSYERLNNWQKDWKTVGEENKFIGSIFYTN